MKSVILVLLIGCGGLAPKSGDTLGDSVRSYNDGVRWGRFEVAAIHIPPKERAQFVDEADDRAKDLKITEYDIVTVEPKGDRVAKVHIKVEWYKETEGTIHETHALQTWEKHGKDWMMVEEARLRGVEMPGLPEPVTREAKTGPTSMKD
jgi:hypothetical protein